MQTSNVGEYHLTINDVIALPDGEIADYRPTAVDDLNIEIRSCGPREESELRLEDLKEENNIVQARPDHKPIVSEEQAATLHPTIIMEVGNPSNMQADSLSNSTSDSFATNQAQTLPAGMSYHVFISHAREDRDWVIEVIEKLEAPPHSLKCCFADRDFELGRSVFENITRCIQSSIKTVIVLSSEFLDSSWCDYEIRITMEMDLTTRRKVLIPVMLRPCRVPDFVGRLTYIEVHNEHFWDRFMSAIQNDYTDPATPHDQEHSNVYNSNALLQLPYYHNMDEIAEIPIYTGYCCGLDTHSSTILHRLSSPSTQITIDDYNLILDIFKRNCYSKCHGCFSKMFLALPCTSFIGGVVLFILALYLSIKMQSDQQHGDDAVPWFIKFAPAICFFLLALLIVFIRLKMGYHAACSFTKSIIEANEISHNYNLLIGYKAYGCCGGQQDKFSIVFYFYNWRLCESHLSDEMTDQNNSDQQLIQIEGSNNSGDPEEQILSPDVDTTISNINQMSAMDLLMSHVPEYVDLYVKMKLSVPVDQRHTRQGECLCQFVENVQVDSTSQSRSYESIFGSRSRFPKTRLSQFLF